MLINQSKKFTSSQTLKLKDKGVCYAQSIYLSSPAFLYHPLLHQIGKEK